MALTLPSDEREELARSIRSSRCNFSRTRTNITSIGCPAHRARRWIAFGTMTTGAPLPSVVLAFRPDRRDVES
jgi:hypothetical protein